MEQSYENSVDEAVEANVSCLNDRKEKSCRNDTHATESKESDSDATESKENDSYTTESKESGIYIENMESECHTVENKEIKSLDNGYREGQESDPSASSKGENVDSNDNYENLSVKHQVRN